MIHDTKTRLLAGLALAGLVAAPLPAAAQGVSTTGGLDIPANVTLLGQMDPNVRTATAVVNGDVITGTDVDHRVALVQAASETPIQGPELERLRMQVLRNLIDETLQIQAATAEEIAITDEEVNQTYARVAAQNFGQNASAMDAYLQQIGSSSNSLKRQIRGELAWQRLLRRNVQPFINVSEEEVTELVERLEASRGTEEYRLGEIFLSSTPETRVAVGQNARKIVEQLKEGGSFVGYARQFSEASTAAVGGDLGFVRLATLPSEISVVAQEMQPGQLVGPVEVPGGFSILYLIDKRQVLTADPRDATLSLKQISISFEPGMTQEQAQGRLQAFTNGVMAMRGCGDAETAASQLGATVVTNDNIQARSLPDQLQNTVLDMQLGQVTPPFGSVEDGVRVLMLCGRDAPQVTAGPDREELMARLEDDRVNKRAQRYLRDLRNDAYIEYN